MKLSVIERFLLGQMMGNYQGNFTNLKLVREGREALSFNEEEIRELKFVQEGNQMQWNSMAAIKYQAVEVPIGENVTSIIKDMLRKLNDDAQLTDQHFSLYEKFMI